MRGCVYRVCAQTMHSKKVKRGVDRVGRHPFKQAPPPQKKKGAKTPPSPPKKWKYKRSSLHQNQQNFKLQLHFCYFPVLEKRVSRNGYLANFDRLSNPIPQNYRQPAAFVTRPRPSPPIRADARRRRRRPTEERFALLSFTHTTPPPQLAQRKEGRKKAGRRG